MLDSSLETYKESSGLKKEIYLEQGEYRAVLKVYIKDIHL